MNSFNELNKKRIELLSKKYMNNKLNFMDLIKLKILTKKIKKIYPMVNNSDYKIINNIKVESEKIRKKIESKLKDLR